MARSNVQQLYTIAFTIIAVSAAFLIFWMLFIRSEADDVTQSGAPANASPTVDSVTTTTSAAGSDIATATPVESSTLTLYFEGAATDNNGCQDINSASVWTGKLYRTNVSNGSSCTADNENCYTLDTANLTLSGCSGAGDLSLAYSWTVPLQYYADPTDSGAPQEATNWTASINAVDASAASGNGTDTIEVASLLALSVTGSVDYGTIALGADSSQQTITFTNTGNRAIDVDQSASSTATTSGDLDCSGSGSSDISASQMRMSLTTGFTYGNGTNDQAIAAAATNYNLTLSKRTQSAASTKDSYLILRMPSTGVRGTCTNTITYTAKADA